MLPALCASSRWAFPGLRVDAPPVPPTPCSSPRLRRTDEPGADVLAQVKARQLLMVLAIYYAFVFAY